MREKILHALDLLQSDNVIGRFDTVNAAIRELRDVAEALDGQDAAPALESQVASSPAPVLQAVLEQLEALADAVQKIELMVAGNPAHG